MKNSLSLEDIYNLAYNTLTKGGSCSEQAKAVAETISRAEQDGSVSHGLFRLPGYFNSLKSGKVNLNPNPSLHKVSKAVLKCNGDRSFAPLIHKLYLNELIQSTKEIGIGVLSIQRVAHFASLWPETETLAESGLIGIACTSYLPVVSPFGASENCLLYTSPSPRD